MHVAPAALIASLAGALSDALDVTARHYLIEAFASGGGEAPRAELLGSQLVQLLLVKHNSDTSAAFRNDVRQFGLAFKKDNPGLRDALMFNEANLQTVVDNGIEGLRTDAQREEQVQMKDENLRNVVGVDEMHPFVNDADRAEGEGEVKGSMQPKIHGLEGIEYDTGNS